jgi:hypothetical protein
VRLGALFRLVDYEPSTYSPSGAGYEPGEHTGPLLSFLQGEALVRLYDVTLSYSFNGGGVRSAPRKVGRLAASVGAVPVVADFGSPADIVNSHVGYKVPLINEGAMVSRMGRRFWPTSLE